MKRVGFRGRLFTILLSFALIPSVVLTLSGGITSYWALKLVGAQAAWDSVAASGNRALGVARTAPLTADQRKALSQFDSTLGANARYARMVSYTYRHSAALALTGAILSFIILALLASRVAGHLSRNMSRPLQELVGWTERIGRGMPLPEGPPRRGAPEFEVLRKRMRDMSRELELGRARAIETERAAALRETARQVAHELKNPLTPIRFAVERLRRESPTLSPALVETVEVLDVESRRLEAMAKSFSQFGRLPEGPQAQIDVGELVRYTARSTVPTDIALAVDVDEATPMIHGHHDALARALSNVILNAVDACRTVPAGQGDGPNISVRVRPFALNVHHAEDDGSHTNGNGTRGVEIAVADSGCGIPKEQLARIWEPYVTSKPGGTGLGLAIARQTVLAHRGSVGAESQPGNGTTIRFLLPTNDLSTGT
ncbi:MAG TPA: HAMP domain-containing sensor histidine kinase [Gemmatimonadaceae bacterium]|nr:HAMP domain-containing sensor histidine kinase [Gemmatimonadaceae bacterium]